MIHRYIDLLEEEVVIPWSMIWNHRRVVGGTDRMMATDTRGANTLGRILGTPLVDINHFRTHNVNLSPDLTEFSYMKVRGTLEPSTRTTDVMIGQADDLSAVAVLATTPANGLPINLGWSPDGQLVYYLRQTTTASGGSEIHVVDRTGAGDTIIWSATSSQIPAFAWGRLGRISPDGTKIAMWVDFDASAFGNWGLWVMNSDGSSPTKVYDAASHGTGEGEFFGWSRDSDWLIVQQIDFAPTPRTETIYKLHPDGTGLTTLYVYNFTGGSIGLDVDLALGNDGIFTPDGTGIICKQEVSVGAANPAFQVGILDAGGSGVFTPFSPQRLMHRIGGNTDPNDGPVLSTADDRVFWLEGPNSTDTSKVVSALVDGSDYRVDYDATDSSTTPQRDDYVFNGFVISIA